MARRRNSSGDARSRLLDAAGRGFRVGGFGGIGVDALAQSAGLTSGAFYAHFGSKAGAFRMVVDEGMAALQAGIAACRQQHGAAWREAFIDFYLGERMRSGLDEACALPSFSADVARADIETRQIYERQLEAAVAALAEGLGTPPDRDRALALLMTLAGGAGAARAVASPTLREEILAATARAARAI